MFFDDHQFSMFFAFMVFVFLFQYLGIPVGSQALVTVPAALILLPLSLVSGIMGAGGAIGGLAIGIIALAAFGMYSRYLYHIFNPQIAFIAAMAATILLIAR